MGRRMIHLPVARCVPRRCTIGDSGREGDLITLPMPILHREPPPPFGWGRQCGEVHGPLSEPPYSVTAVCVHMMLSPLGNGRFGSVPRAYCAVLQAASGK